MSTSFTSIFVVVAIVVPFSSSSDIFDVVSGQTIGGLAQVNETHKEDENRL
jgi:hypothetical protein